MRTDRSRTASSRRFKASTMLGRSALACSTLAIAAALTSAPVRAQSFQANSTTAFGNAVVTTGTNTTTVTVSSPSAVIDWTPTDTAISPSAIAFQPNGTTATFTGAADFAVLNRIVPVDPTRAIQFDGIVNSLVNSSPGGTVFFYSPGGIILGANAQLNVGNLGLTSANPVVDGAGNWFAGRQVQFQASASGRAVSTVAGSQITASAEGSFVALVAPSISHRGSIDVNGQAALVSADAATITFAPSGLFDIQVTSGTSATGTTLFSDGAIVGPASSGAGDNHRIYAVAVPKNDAITLAIAGGSQLGFDIAGAANLVGNAVLLSAGQNIVAGNIAAFSGGTGSGTADATVRNASITSNLQMRANNNAFFFSQSGISTSAASDVSIIANAQSKLSSDGTGSSTTVAGNLTLQRGNLLLPHVAEVFASNNGNVLIGGTATLNTNGAGIAATGGTAIIQAMTGGDVTINGATVLQSFGLGGPGGSNADGANGFGGSAQIFASDAGSTVTINSTATLQAIGFGGTGNGTGSGGTGTGGVAIINAQAASGAAVSITGNAVISAVGVGGNATTGNGGAGFGGAATAAASVSNSVSFGGNVDILTTGVGGNSTAGNAGSGTGGTARITLFDNATLSITGNATVHGIGLNGTGLAGAAVATGTLAAVSVQQNSVLTVGGFLEASASGLGDRSFLTPPLPSSGAGVAGTATVDAFSNGSITVGSVLRARSDATATNGRNATGGTAIVAASSGGDIAANELNVAADGVGGNDTGTGAGTGTGGTASLFANGAGSTVTIANGNSTGVVPGSLDFVSAEGFGGITNGGGSGVGGTGTGGTATMGASAGAVLNAPATGQVRVFARGTGGGANAGVAGGDAIGGTINIFADAATLTSGSGLLPSAFSQGGSVIGTPSGAINGGNSIGGTRNITVNNGGSMTISSPGGTVGGSGGNGSATGRGGNATGGTANLTVDNNSTLNIPGSFSVLAINSPGTGLIGGNATGGSAFARIANRSTLTTTGPAATSGLRVAAQIQATTPTLAGSTNGGTLTAGTATLVVENATLNVQQLDVVAGVFTAPVLYSQGSNATGGTATLQLIGGTLTADTVNVLAGGQGGSLGVGQSGVAGNGTGGLARLIATGGNSTVTVANEISIEADGTGGNVDGAVGTTTGSGTGGRAALVSSGGATVTLNALSVSLSASGEGGAAVNGTADVGGFGTGGQADLFANSGSITINTDLFLEADNEGGEGLIGGAGIGRTDNFPNALIRAQNGSITVTGQTVLSAVGAAETGASAQGGLVVVDALSNAAGSSTITLASLVADAFAVGGAGRAAASDTEAGGAGGVAFGGNIQILGSAGNGNLVVTGSSFLDASAFGGSGGAGNSGATSTAGGRGGAADAGFIQVGTKSGPDVGPANTGSGQFGFVGVVVDAFGGQGGDGGTGTTPAAGGAGGDGFGGAATLLVRGSPVVMTDFNASANGTGGNGGTGSVQGNGGGGYAGDSSLVVTQRFSRTERGSLNANNVTFNAIGFGGTGATPGGSFFALAAGTENELFIRQSDVTLANLTLVTGGELAPDRTVMGFGVDPVTGMQVPMNFNLVSDPFDVTLANSTLNISGGLIMSTPGLMRVSLDSSTFNASDLNLSANNFVLPAVRPTTLGTINVSRSLDLSSNLDFLAYANFSVPFDTSFSWDGAFQIGSFTGASLFLEAVGPVTFDNIVGDDVELVSSSGITTGSITASQTIDLDAGGGVNTGVLTAGDSAFVTASGAVNVGAVSAGLVNPSPVPSDNYTIGLRSLTSVTAGNLAARGVIGLSSPGSISVASISSGPIVLALAGTGFSSGAIQTGGTNGRVYIANFSMETLGGQVGPIFNPGPILAAPQVQVNGPIAINGSVSTGLLQASALQSLSISGATTATGSSVLVGGTTLTTGNVTAGQLALFAAGGATTLGDIDVGIAIQGPGQPKISIGSTSGPVTTGALRTTGDLGVQTGGSITTGALRGRDVLLLPGSGATTGAISAIATGITQPQGGRVYIGNFSQASQTANVFQPFSQSGVLSLFNRMPSRTNGAITIGGTVSAGSFVAATTQGFTASAITIGTGSQTFFSDIFIDSGQTITVNGPWRAESMELRSSDIEITATGTLTGFVDLISTNQSMAVIGDISSNGATQVAVGAYRLTDAEFDRISGGFSFGARDNVGEVDLLVGDLSVDASRFASADTGGEIYVYSDDDFEEFVGRIRVDGNVAITGVPTSTSRDETFGIEFDAKSFELNAATGSVTISGANGALTGAIEIEGENIHVASDAILLKLRADPFYEGSVQELNAPAAVQRPDGVLRAGILQLEGTQTIYIQNTGNSAVPAGFVTTLPASDEEDGTTIGPDEDRSSTDQFKIVINGQIQTDTGLLTGKAAFDQIVTAARADLDTGEEFGLGLDPDSTLNNCNIISGTCALSGSDPIAAISSEFNLAIVNALADAPVPGVIEEGADSATESAADEAAQSAEDEEEAEADASSPIAPLAPLINTRPLNPAVNVVEPVAGAGNPALIGSAVNEATAQGDTP